MNNEYNLFTINKIRQVCLLFCVMVLFVPEGPRWLLLRKGNDEEAFRVLSVINPETAADTIAKKTFFHIGFHIV